MKESKLHTVLTALIDIIWLGLLWLLSSSLKTNFEFLAESPFALPAVPQWINYVNALTVAGLGRMLLNSVIVGVSATVVNVIIASMGAYCISRFRFRGREGIYTLFTAGILVPLSALMVPYFVIINKLGLYNTYGGMILLYSAIGIPMSTFLIRGLMDSSPWIWRRPPTSTAAASTGASSISSCPSAGQASSPAPPSSSSPAGTNSSLPT